MNGQSLETVLIVDDEATALSELSVYLSRKGYNVLMAANGADALEIVQIRRPRIILTDYSMPVMNGLELLREVKQIDRNIQVLMVSGQGDLRVAVDALKEDAVDFVEKPVHLPDLLEKINQALERSRQFSSQEPITSLTMMHEAVEVDGWEISNLRFKAPLDDYYAPKIRQDFKLLSASRPFRSLAVCIFSDVTYINNVGLNLLVELHARLQESCDAVVFASMADHVFEYLKRLGYHQHFSMEKRIDDARRRLIQMNPRPRALPY